MNTELIDHLESVLRASLAGSGWGNVYRITKDYNFESIETVVGSENLPLVIYDARYLPKDHCMLHLKDFSASFLFTIHEHCASIGFRPLFKSKGKFNGTDMDYVTTVHCPNEGDGIVLQAYLDTL